MLLVVMEPILESRPPAPHRPDRRWRRRGGILLIGPFHAPCCIGFVIACGWRVGIDVAERLSAAFSSAIFVATVGACSAARGGLSVAAPTDGLAEEVKHPEEDEQDGDAYAETDSETDFEGLIGG